MASKGFAKTVVEYLAQETVKVPASIGLHGDTPREDYVSKVDGSYVGLVGFSEKEKDSIIQFWIDHEVTLLQGAGCKVARIGFSEREQKWYGWSHRAIFGFGVGSEVTKESSGHMPRNKEEFMEAQLRFWEDDLHVGTRAVEGVEGSEKGVRVAWEYSEETPNLKLRGTTGGHFSPYPEEWGRGEWTATTLMEAREMAIDFAESVG
jgi:hypothetical protein